MKSFIIAIATVAAIMGYAMYRIGSDLQQSPAVKEGAVEQPAPVAPPVQAAPRADSGPRAITDSLEGMRARDEKPLQCTGVSQASDTYTSAKVYVAGGSLRGDFVSRTAQMGNLTTHMLVSSTSVTTWTDLGKGAQFALQDGVIGAPQGEIAAEIFAEMYDFSCTPWRTDMGKFVVPSNVKF